MDKCRVPGVADAFRSIVERLRSDPQFVVTDKKEIWRKAFPDLPNHRHTNLPGAWRMAWSVIRQGTDQVVLVVFLGSHEAYEETYGFRKR